MTTVIPSPVRTPFPEALEGNLARDVGSENLSQRLPHVDADHVHLVAHGSPDPRHAASVRRLAARVAALTRTEVTASFLEHNTPRAGTALLSPIRPTVAPSRHRVTVLPLLLTAGVHWHRDIPPVVGHQGSHHRLLPPLAPDVFAGVIAGLVTTADCGVVVASAGSSRPQSVRRFAALAEQVETILAAAGRPLAVRVAMSPAEVAQTAGPGDVVAPVLLADGVFADRIRDAAAAAKARTSDIVGDTWAGTAAIAASLTRQSPALRG